MGDPSQPDASWYTCKENVQPLAKGRDVSKIEESVSVVKSELEIKRAAYEEKILLDDGDDPIANWIEFIDWIEQSYPGGGKEGRLMDVLTDCVQRFIEDSRYSDDERFYSIFCRYRRRLSDPLEKYDSLFVKKIFTKLACFYIDWSWLFECAGNFKEADNVLDRGLLIGAEPADDIITARVQLRTRVSKKIADERAGVSEDQDGERKALTKKADTPVDRFAPVENDFSGMSVASSNAPNPVPEIYVDEENQDLVMSTGSVKSSIVNEIEQNAMNPGKWGDLRLKKKSIVKPQPEFVIYEESEESKTSSDRSRSRVDSVSPDLFKVRKRNDDSPALVKPENLANSKFYFDFEKIYVCGTEYSFEEIRYNNMMKAKRLADEQKNRKDQMESLLKRIAELEAKVIEQEKKDQEQSLADKKREIELKILNHSIGLAEKDREQQEKLREMKDKERDLKDKERELRAREIDDKERERALEEQKRLENDETLRVNEEKRAKNELDRMANESERLNQEKERQQSEHERESAEKERVMQEKEREINDKERGIKMKEMDQAIQSLDAKLSTIIKLLQEKKPKDENCEVSTIMRNLINGSFNDNTLVPIVKPPVPVKDFTIFKDETTTEPTDIAPLIRFDITEHPRAESTAKAKAAAVASSSIADVDTTTIKQKLERMDPKMDFDHIHRGSMHFRVSEAFTMMVPPSEDECLPNFCSTPGK